MHNPFKAQMARKDLAAEAGVDSVFLGPSKLSAAMGHVGTPDAVATCRGIGVDYIGCASDPGLMMRQCAADLGMIRSQNLPVNSSGY